MATISEDLASDDLNSLKFLLGQVLPREKLEKSKVSQHSNVGESFCFVANLIVNSWQSFLDVVIELEKLDMVSSQSVDLVEECLVGIGRLDLTRKVSAYKKSGQSKAFQSAM